MRISRRLIFFLAMLLLCLSISYALFHEHLENSVSILTKNVGTYRYDTVGVGHTDLGAAAGWSGDRVLLRVFTLDGTLLNSWTAFLPEETGGIVHSVYPYGDGLVFLGIYSKNAETLSLYRLSSSGGVDLLMRQECPGRFSSQRRTNTTLSLMTEENGQLSFALLSKTEGVQCYAFDPEDGGLMKTGSYEYNSPYSVLVTPEGKLSEGGVDSLILDGRKCEALPEDQIVTRLTRARIGWYYLDARSLGVYYSDLGGTSVERLYLLDNVLNALPEGFDLLTDVELTRDGHALMLLNGTMLIVANESELTRLDGVLTYSKASAIMRLITDALASLLAAAILWFIVCGPQRGYTPMVVTWGGILISLSVASVIFMCFWVMHPNNLRAAVTANATVVDTTQKVVRETLSSVSGEGDLLTDSAVFGDASIDAMSFVLESSPENDFRNVTIFRPQKIGSKWYLRDGSRAELSSRINAKLDNMAAESESGYATEQVGDTFRFTHTEGNTSLYVTFDGAATLHSVETEKNLAIRAAVVCCVSILILFLVGRDLRLLAKEMERLAAGGIGAQLRLRTGDELESMANTVSGLAESLQEQKIAQEALVRSSQRFVPEQVLSLLGKRSIEEVDKSTLTVRRMAVMAVRFDFPDSLYSGTENSRLLFDSINRVIERTAPIATKMDGTVFNYTYYGYEVVMKAQSSKVVSTAVAIQQEVLALNEEHARAGQPPVSFRIALDVGDVLVGVVGDDHQMEPTMISSSFAAVNTLLDVAKRLKARILCTEAIIGQAENYGSRYMGRCWINSAPVRVYEIFDGDEYSVRKSKAASVERFSNGVYALYGGDTAQAKREFLDLAHDNPGDGGVRYYLYLADKMARNPDQICGLNLPEQEEE